MNRYVLFFKVHIFWEGHKIVRNLHLALHRTKVRWRFRKILWPSQNIWTLCHFRHNTLFGNHITYPIKNGRPALHCDTLKNCEHGKTNVIKGGDTIIGPLPFLQANWSIGFASVGSHGCFEWIVWMTRHAHRSFRDDLFYFRKKKRNQKKIVN